MQNEERDRPWKSQASTPVVPLVLLAFLSLGASCSGGSEEPTSTGGGGTAPAGPRVESREQVDTSDLARSELRVWVELVNDLLSPCGEPISVGRCVSEERGCRRCVPAARYIVRLISDGYERTEVEELYGLRYGNDSAVEIDIEGAPSRGAPMAPITIVTFSDFECPYCARAHPVLERVLREFEGQVRLVFRNFPLSLHPHAMPAARAAVAAGNQGKFWEMHDMLFEHQTQLEDDDLIRYAREIGLDVDRFRSDLSAEATQRRVERDREIGTQLNIEGTPSFFVNGRRFREPVTALPSYLREELER